MIIGPNKLYFFISLLIEVCFLFLCYIVNVVMHISPNVGLTKGFIK